MYNGLHLICTDNDLIASSAEKTSHKAIESEHTKVESHTHTLEWWKWIETLFIRHTCSWHSTQSRHFFQPFLIRTHFESSRWQRCVCLKVGPGWIFGWSAHWAKFSPNSQITITMCSFSGSSALTGVHSLAAALPYKGENEGKRNQGKRAERAREGYPIWGESFLKVKGIHPMDKQRIPHIYIQAFLSMLHWASSAHTHWLKWIVHLKMKIVSF